MSLKQIRISDPSMTRQRIQEFVNKKISIVLKNNTVVFGKLEQIKEDTLFVVNMRVKRMKFALSDIVEIYIDTNP